MSARYLPAFVFVVALHVAALYALQSGLARQFARQVLASPVFAQLIAPPPQAAPVPPPPPAPRPARPVRQAPVPVTHRPPPSNKAITLPPVEPAVAASAAPVKVPEVSPAPPTPVVAPRFDAAYLDNPHPAYPPLARRMGEEGKVVLKVKVSAEGRAADVRVHASSGFAALDEAALKAVWSWRFIPARQGDVPVAASVLVPIRFNLD